MYFWGTFRFSSVEITPTDGAGSTGGDDETPGAVDVGDAEGKDTGNEAVESDGIEGSAEEADAC